MASMMVWSVWSAGSSTLVVFSFMPVSLPVGKMSKRNSVSEQPVHVTEAVSSIHLADRESGSLKELTLNVRTILTCYKYYNNGIMNVYRMLTRYLHTHTHTHIAIE